MTDSCVWWDLGACAWYYVSFMCMWYYLFTTRYDFRYRSIDLQSLEVTWLFLVCDMTYAHVCILWITCLYDITCSQKEMMFEIARCTSMPFGHHSFMCVTWPERMHNIIHMYVPLLVHNKKRSWRSLDTLAKPCVDMTHSCVWRTCVIMHVCDITCAQDQNRWFIHKNKYCSTSLNRLPELSGEMTNSCTWRDVCVRVTRPTRSCVMTHSQKQVLFQIAV